MTNLILSNEKLYVDNVNIAKLFSFHVDEIYICVRFFHSYYNKLVDILSNITLTLLT